MKTNKIYQAPTIERATVELEGGFCGSIDESQKSNVETTGHELHSASDTQIDNWNTHSWE
ncbi:MAG: hypothetical protein J6S11_01670 [Bacteroidaceae bacterium]|jgi:hypothetical protein|nr:hypothetical protein [Bacteroidaceae bacterium]